jgi:predicted nucleotidyltransferase
MQVVQESLEEMLKAEVDLAMKDEIPTVSPPLIENIVDMMDHPMCGLEIDHFYS